MLASPYHCEGIAMSTAATLPADAPAAALLDVHGVAQLLNCSARHVIRLADAGLMPSPVRIGRLTRWPRRVVQEWIDGGCPSRRRA